MSSERLAVSGLDRRSTVDARRSAEDLIDAAVVELIVAEKGMALLLANARYALFEVEEENRRLKREVAQAHVNWYTEQQLADRMGISKDTLARLRKAKKIPFVRITPTVIRYSTLQEAQIAELLQSGGSGAKGNGQRGSHLREAVS